MKKFFQLGLGCLLFFMTSVSLKAADVNYYAVLRMQLFEQTLTTAPATLASNGYAFSAFVVPAGSALNVTSATVKPSNDTPLQTLSLDTGLDTWRFEERFNTQSALEAKYPVGTVLSPVNYTVTMYTVHDGTPAASLNFLFISTPATPQAANLDEGQSIDTTRDFVLRWNPLAGGSALDILQLLVHDAASNIVYASPTPFQVGALNGTNTSAVIPANVLPPNTNLTGHLITAKIGVPNLSSYPGATGIATLGKDTAFPLMTRPVPVSPRLEVISSNALPFVFAYAGETNRNYHLQASPDLQTWQDLLVTNSPTGAGTFSDPQSSNLPQRFYRIKVGP